MLKTVLRDVKWVEFDGETLKEFRHKYGWSQVELASILGVERRSVERWEKSKAPDLAAHALTLLTLLFEQDKELISAVHRMLDSNDGHYVMSALGLDDPSWSRR